MKKFLSLLAVLAVCLAPLVISASAATVDSGKCGANGDNVTWKQDSDGTLTISGEGEMYYFTGAEMPWYKKRTDITEAIIQNGVTSISGFFECTNLASVTIADSVMRIGAEAFYGCTSLTSVTIPDGVTYIDFLAFYGCTGLTSVTLPNNMTFIGGSCFGSCTNLTSVTIPDSVTKIGDGAFMDCTGLTSMTIPDSVEFIESSAFSGCTGLTSVTFEGDVPPSIWRDAFTDVTATVYYPAGDDSWDDVVGQNYGGDLTWLPDNAVAYGECGANLTWVLDDDGVLTISGEGSIEDLSYYCLDDGTELNSHIVKIVIEDGITAIGNSAFGECGNLISVNIPDSVTSIGDSAFCNCPNLAEVTIPDSVTEIAAFAFYGCKSLTSVTIPGSVTVINRFTFYNCTGLKAVTFDSGVRQIGDKAFGNCTSLTSVTMHGNTNVWGEEPFENCAAFTTLNLGDDVTVSISLFSKHPTLTAFTVTSGNRTFSAKNGVLFSKNGMTLVDYPRGKAGSYAIPDDVMYIGQEAFCDCANLTAVTIPDSVTEIGGSAFKGCTGLTEITIPNSVTSIGYEAFEGCASLKSVTIPNSVTTIAEEAFQGCTGLTEITIPNSVTTIDSHVFSDCTGLKTVTIPSGVTRIGYSAFFGCTGLTSVNIPSSVTTISYGVFSGCTGLKAVTIPNGVTTIGAYAFNNCTGLTTVSIPDSVTTIGERAFRNCTDLTTVTIPNSVTNIGDYAFDVTTVRFKGTREQWEALIGENTTCFPDGVTVHFDEPVGTPELDVELNSKGKPVLTWSKVNNATKYYIYASTSGKDGTFSRISSTTGTALTHSSAAENTKYYYKACAVVNGSTGDFSDTVSVTTANLTPTLSVDTNAKGKPVLEWEEVDGATKYYVYVSTSGKTGTFSRISITTGTKLTHSSATYGKTYYYKIRAIHGSTLGNFSDVESIKCAIPVPELEVELNSKGKPYLTWSKVSGAEKYYVYVSTSGKTGTFNRISITTGTALTHSSAKEDATYYYKVRAIVGGVSGDLCDSEKITTANLTPTLTVTTNSAGKPVLEWEKVDGATKYYVYRSLSGEDGTFTRISTTTGVKLINSSAVSGTEYFYKIRAVHGSTLGKFGNTEFITCG